MSNAVPFSLETCTLVESTSATEQEAFVRFMESCDSLSEFWERCHYSPWMLRTLRRQAADLPASPERGLRQFALHVVDRLAGTDVPALAKVVEAVKGRLDATSTAADLERVRAETQAVVSPCGVSGLPRFSPYAAGALAVWHAANPDPFEAAYWTSRFKALHDGFKAVCDRAAAWKPEDRAQWRGGWREAAFARTHPDVFDGARAETYGQLAQRLRTFLPAPFGPPVAVEVFVASEDGAELMALLCRTCAAQVDGVRPLVLPDGRAYGCGSCERPFVQRVH
jgi:hypothetical protein